MNETIQAKRKRIESNLNTSLEFDKKNNFGPSPKKLSEYANLELVQMKLALS